MRLLAVTFAALTVACGGGWSDADTSAATNAARLEARTIELEEGDGGASIRALSRAALCANASMLYRHNKPIPEAGADCKP